VQISLFDEMCKACSVQFSHFVHALKVFTWHTGYFCPEKRSALAPILVYIRLLAFKLSAHAEYSNRRNWQMGEQDWYYNLLWQLHNLLLYTSDHW